MGADISYTCINNCTIEVELRAYRDCTGSNFISANSFNIVPQTFGCSPPTQIGSWPQEVVQEVTPICGTITTACSQSGAPINGVEEFYWVTQYDICGAGSQNCVFVLEWGTCCRNPAISNLNNPGSQSIYVGSTTLNTNIQPCNSSPQFTVPPVPYICQGQPFTFNQGAFDPEGDSLAYSLGPCYTTSNSNQVPYAAGYSAQQPLGPSWNVSINPVTGDVSVIPNPAGNIVVAVLCVYVEEWRDVNGVPTLLNTIVRDVQMTVIPCPNNTVPTSTGVSNLSGGSQNGPWEITVCAGTPISLDIPSTDPDAGQVQTMFWNSNLAGLGATFGSGAQQDTIVGNQPTGTFNWTPQNTGVYTFLITIVDDACPILGQAQYSVTINVNGGLPNAGITATPTGCTNVSLNANPGTGNTGPYTYQWFGDGNLTINANNTQQTLNHTYPGPGTYEVNVLITDSYGCQSVLTDTVIIPTGPTADAGPDISICSGYSINLGAAPIGGQTYNWFPATGLSSTTVSDPVFQLTNNGPTPDTIDFTVSATSGFCTSFDYVTVVVYPTPVPNIVGDAQICVGGTANLTASGGTTYLWSTNETTASISVSPTTTTTYTVTAITNGCASQPFPWTVTVTPGPSAVIAGVDSVCPGSDAVLTVAGGDAWDWSTGANVQTITIQSIYQDTTISVIPYDQGCAGPSVDYTVYVHEKPVADFTNTDECIGNSTTFTDGSSIGTGSIIGWRWDFGDPASGPANISASQNPTHAFTAPGNYNVTLVSTSSNGCMDTVVHAIVVNPLPTPDFSFNKACAGFEMDFTDLSSSAAGIASWTWTFGNGAFSTQQNPSYTYPNPGPYDVTLMVVDNNGCENSVTKTVFVYPNPTAGFTWEHSCFNSITDFTSTSNLVDPYGTTLDAHSWNFGDPASGSDNTSNATNPTHNFTQPGTYNVTLTVTTSQGCENTIVIPVNVPAVPPLIVQNDTVCSGFSGMLQIVGGWQPNTSLEWFQNPVSIHPFHYGNVYMSPPVAITTTFWVAQRDEEGCLSPKVAVHVIVDPAPRVDWLPSANEVEIPNAIVEFNILQESNGPIVSYAWDFGDGNTSSEPEPVHQYTEEGVFDLMLTVIDDFGCETTYSVPQSINVTKFVAIWVPNAFTPNGDGHNDELYVVPRLITDFNIQLYDRWGKLIFQSDDMNFRWDGNAGSGEALPEGVYTYIINAVDFDGERVKEGGTITLFR